jgi:hypothetical protein
MDYALQHDRASTRRKHTEEAAEEPMDAAADFAVPGAVFPAHLRAVHAVAVGISLLLLVSIFMGDCDFGVAGDRLPQTEELTANKERLAGIADAALPPGREKRRRADSIPARRLAGGSFLADCRAEASVRPIY